MISVAVNNWTCTITYRLDFIESAGPQRRSADGVKLRTALEIIQDPSTLQEVGILRFLRRPLTRIEAGIKLDRALEVM